MATFTRAADLMKSFEHRVRKAKKDHNDLHDRIVRGSYQDFLSLTSGTIKAKQRKQMGYPYAREGSSFRSIDSAKDSTKRGVNLPYDAGIMRGLRTPAGERFMRAKGGRRAAKTGKVANGKRQLTAKGQLSLLPINKDTGELRKGIRLKGPIGATRMYSLYSEAPHATYVLSLHGTKRMVARRLLGPDGELRKRHNGRMAVIRKILREENGST